jgi:spore maturation protein CgeB
MDVNMRVFENMAGGRAMLLTNTYEGLGYEELFDEGRHYVGFTTEEEAVEKALYYANHPDEARAIAEEGQRHVLANHTYADRCRELLSALKTDGS